MGGCLKFMDTLFNLTTPQQNIWDTEMFFSGTSVNNICGYININQKVNFDILEKTVNLYVKHTDTMKYHIILDNDKVLQYESSYKPFKIDTVDVKDMNEAISLATRLLDVPFNVIDSDLFKFTMYRFPNGNGGLIGVFHHLIGDAWAMSLLISRLMDIYSSLLKNDENFSDFPSYSSYISSSSDYLSSPKFEKDKSFWNSQFDTVPEHTFIYNKASIPDVSGAREVFNIDNVLYGNISEFCKKNGVSTYSFFMAIYLLYLAKINNTKSALVGTPVLNRSNFAEKQIAGMFVSNVPFKIDIDSKMNFIDFVKSVALKQSSIFRHQRYPYMELLKYVKEKYDINENLYDFVLSYQNARNNSTSSDIPYTSDWLSNTKVSNSLEVHFYDMDDSGKLNLYYNYQTAKFTASEIRTIHERILFMAENAITNPILKDIAVTTDKEMAFINDFNHTEYSYDRNESVVHAFERQVKKNGDSTAVVFKGSFLSYLELDKESNMLANMLIDKGISNGDVVGIMFNRCFNLHIAMWGILKSGASFMLIDPSLPEDRINYMLTNAKAKLVITDLFVNFDTLDISERKNYPDSLPDLNYGLSSNGDIVCHGDDRFCVLYTSGSTGTPKGVELRCRSVLNLVNSFKEILHTNKCDVYLSCSTVSFDMFIVENFLSILSGKMVVLADEDEQKIPAFTSKLINDYNIDFIVSTPSKISLLLGENDCLKSIKVMQLGGEVLKPSLYRALKNVTDAEIHNGYGPSECFACSSNKFVTSENDVNIGSPYLNVKMFIMNSDNNILPPDVPGELVIGGDGVGLGYINNTELTLEKFIDYDGKPFYRSGDVAMLSSAGELVYCGRRDNQIKLHGLRIELDEITAKLMALDFIKNAISVIKKVNGIDCICSYVVVNSADESGNKVSVSQIKKSLAKVLPNYMVPSHIVLVDNLPITLNGKVDVHNLPEIEIAESAFVPCSTDLEKSLEGIWSKILNLSKISANSSFFELGGDSLCSIRLVSEIYSKFNKKVDIKDIFDYPTISELASFIDKLETVSSSFSDSKDVIHSVIKEDSDGTSLFPASFAQKGIFYASSMYVNSTLYNTPFGILFDKVPDVSNLEKAISIIINSHQAFRTSFVSKDGDVYQKILDKIDFKLDVVDYKNNDFVKPFDLESAPIMHVQLNKFDGKALLQLDIHHIICDGASIHIFAKELCDIYNNISNESSYSIDKLDYLDFSMSEKINNNDKEFWLSKFEDTVPLLNMPTEFERGNVLSFSGNSIYDKIDNFSAINRFCKENEITPYMFLLSCFYILLYKYTMQNDLVVGTPVSGRDDTRFSDTFGMFVNTIALRQDILGSTSFADFIKSVKHNTLDAFSHQSYPFSELIKNLNITRDSSRHPLFDVMFIYESMGFPKLNLKGLNSEYVFTDTYSSKFDFSLEITPYNDYFRVRLEYCDKLFGIKFMETLLDCYKNIISAVLEEPDISISSINMLKIAPDVYNHFDIPKDLRVIDLFEKQVLETPDNISLVFGNESYTYKELEIKVNKLANYIKGLPEFKYIDGSASDVPKVIGIIMNRRSELIISMLAILKLRLRLSSY